MSTASTGWASPWIGTTEPQLHYDLQTLVDYGVLDVASMTFPVPWKGIGNQLQQADMQQLSPAAQVSLRRLRYYLAVQNEQQWRTTMNFYAATDKSRMQDFDSNQEVSARLNVTSDIISGRWSAHISVNHDSGGANNVDQSYLAYQFGDWNIRLGAMDQWWGPAMSSSLILSNNARPIPSIALSRSTATASEHPWLAWLGPWYFTAQMGRLESERDVANPRLWSTRFTFTPIKRLEIGASWAAMWGGEGQGNSFSDFWDVVTFRAICADGSAQCDEALDTKKGNHLAGFDIKYTFDVFSRPLSLYAQRIGEDAVDFYRPTDNANLIGASTYLWGGKLYIEHSDTNIACASASSTVTNCYYEHGTYTSGYRYQGRAIGSTFDSDATALTLGYNKHFSNGDVMQLTARHLKLNEDGQRPSPVLTDDVSERTYQLGGFYQSQWGDWMLRIGGHIEQRDFTYQQDDTDYLLYTHIRYLLNDR